jgi:hypothetical protein
MLGSIHCRLLSAKRRIHHNCITLAQPWLELPWQRPVSNLTAKFLLSASRMSLHSLQQKNTANTTCTRHVTEQSTLERGNAGCLDAKQEGYELEDGTCDRKITRNALERNSRIPGGSSRRVILSCCTAFSICGPDCPSSTLPNSTKSSSVIYAG